MADDQTAKADEGRVENGVYTVEAITVEHEDGKAQVLLDLGAGLFLVIPVNGIPGVFFGQGSQEEATPQA